jgi:hypothetical protein
MEKFPPAFPAGDMNDETQDYRLPNAVFNTLKLHSQKEEKYVSKYCDTEVNGVPLGMVPYMACSVLSQSKLSLHAKTTNKSYVESS